MQVTVLQWNIWYREPIENILKTLQAIDADIVCLQELSINNSEQTVSNTVAYLAGELGFNVTSCEIPLEDQEMNIANAIFTRFDMVSKRNVWINQPSGTNKYDDQYRAYVEADVKVQNTTLRIGTVHMSYTHAFEPTERKLAETDNLIQEIKDNDTDFILTGDFNATPDSKVIKQLGKQLVHAGPEISENTWATKSFSYGGFVAKELNWRLDYIFTSKDIKTVEADVIKTEFSDHLPVLATFDIDE